MSEVTSFVLTPGINPSGFSSAEVVEEVAFCVVEAEFSSVFDVFLFVLFAQAENAKSITMQRSNDRYFFI